MQSFTFVFCFLVIALITIPWMLLVNPYLLWKKDKDHRDRRERNGGDIELDKFNNDYEVFKDEKVTLLGHEEAHFSYNFVN